ncbi:hypothetical protein STSP2_00061 [Anaerohalosphaera lusitana]|uniref:PilZ domain-containing protein n=1 Tax=Anaerohalosphaera lusitana TaxID=1936003 RepID=A0A1U9NG69_9BACT|nr:PilZ domain-containing protein [Anaerohalosphaera lusitana]AQT66923.1 hypothetical protein STSP2_00061 [Anaerohalosphaera lusitana]
MYIDSITTFLPVLAAKGLTPSQRWDAMRDLDSGMPDFLLDGRFIAAGIIAVAMLLLIWYLYRRHLHDREAKLKRKKFYEVSVKHGLDHEQRTILALIARYAELNDPNKIFESNDIYDLGAAKLMKQKLTQGRSVPERQYFNAQITKIKQLLGLKDYTDTEDTRLSAQTSRKIPVGKYLLLTKVDSEQACPMTAEVIENTNYEFKLKTDETVDSNPGQEWRVHYQLGAMIWNFETVELNSQGKVLTLSHSDKVNFINRRKFAHAEVDLNAYIASFPQTFESSDKSSICPQFVKARVIELSGPGLLMRTSLKAKVGHQVLVTLELEHEQVVQSTAKVRRLETNDNETLLGIEMTALSESSINELIAVTNHAIAQRAKHEKQEQQELVESGVNADD